MNDPDKEQFGGIFDGLTDGIVEKAIESVLDKFKIEESQVDKAKALIDMVEFTKIDGDSVLVVKVGTNIEVRIKV
jgi:hypothetical protein